MAEQMLDVRCRMSVRTGLYILLRFAIACDLGAQAARLPTSRRRVSNFRPHARCMSGAPIFALEALTAGEPPALPAKSIAWPLVASICKPL